MKKLAAWITVVMLGCSLLGGAAQAAANEGRPRAATKPQRNPGEKVNVNTAGVDELSTIPGIGPALAGRIVAHRQQNGPFKKLDELLAVKGIGAKLLAKIEAQLSLETPAK